MSQVGVAISILIIAGLLMLLGYNLPKTRMLFMSIGFFTLMSGAFANYSNWLPQTRGEVPEEIKVEGDFSKFPPEKLAEIGEAIIFGKVVGGNPVDSDVGKAQCPLCHRVTGTVIRDRAPDLKNIGLAAEQRTKDPRYLKPDTVQTESFSGSGRASNAVEYLAESHACPDCFVVEGFGEKGSNDRKSPMPIIHKPPIALSMDELVAVDIYLFVKDGLPPPAFEDIKKAYEKFIPEKDRITKAPVTASVPAGGLDPSKMALPDDTPIQMITKMGCAACHRIPTIDFAKAGVLGPLLVEGSNAARRIASPEYKAAKKAGTAHATSPKEYIIESIMNPSAFIVPGFPTQPGGKSLMPPDFANKFTYAAVSKLADFLVSLDVNMAIKENLDRSPFEKEGSLQKKAEQDLGTAVKAEVLAQKE